MPKLIDIDGMKFGRLTVINRLEGDSSKCKCVCECGTEKTFWVSAVRKGLTQSCGCIKRETDPHNKRHGMTGTPTYKTWAHMLYRCTNPSSHSYKDYGGRGITVCERWLTFDNFFADMGVKPEGTSIDREDNDKGYYPGNCRWLDKTGQANNRRSSRIIAYNGCEFTMAELARKFDISLGTLWFRLDAGWDIEKALKTPVLIGRNQFTEDFPAV